MNEINRKYLGEEPFSYSGKNRVYEHYPNQTKAKIDEALSYNDIYTRFRQHRKSNKYSPTYVHKKRELFQSDITFFTADHLVKANHGFKYLHCTIDVFTKMAWVYPLKSNTCKNTLTCFKDIFKQCGKKPERLQSDRGSEFKCLEFKKFLKDNDIHHYFSYSKRKCAVIERFNLSMQQLLYKLMAKNNSYEWTKFLDQAMKIYLNRKHTTIQMSPIDGEKEENQNKIRQIYHSKYEEAALDIKKPKYKVGDTVRIWSERSKFHRGYMEDFSREYFTIIEVLTNLPVPRYKLSDVNDENIIGSFFEDEIVKYNVQPDQYYDIEKVIKERGKGAKKELFVKYKGWPNSFNEWVNASNVKNVK